MEQIFKGETACLGSYPENELFPSICKGKVKNDLYSFSYFEFLNLKKRYNLV